MSERDPFDDLYKGIAKLKEDANRLKAKVAWLKTDHHLQKLVDSFDRTVTVLGEKVSELKRDRDNK